MSGVLGIRGCTAAADLPPLVEALLPPSAPVDGLYLRECHLPRGAWLAADALLESLSKLYLLDCTAPGDDWDAAVQSLADQMPSLQLLHAPGLPLTTGGQGWLAARGIQLITESEEEENGSWLWDNEPAPESPWLGAGNGSEGSGAPGENDEQSENDAGEG